MFFDYVTQNFSLFKRTVVSAGYTKNIDLLIDGWVIFFGSSNKYKKKIQHDKLPTIAAESLLPDFF
jgi:hypothetical protein